MNENIMNNILWKNNMEFEKLPYKLKLIFPLKLASIFFF